MTHATENLTATSIAALMKQRERLRGRLRSLRISRPSSTDRRAAFAEIRSWNNECVARAATEPAFASYLVHGSDR